MNRTLRLIGAVVLVPLWFSDSISETENIPPDRDGRPIRTVFSSDEVCAHFADGDNWTTEFVFMNMGGKSDPAGRPPYLIFSYSAVSGTGQQGRDDGDFRLSSPGWLSPRWVPDSRVSIQSGWSVYDDLSYAFGRRVNRFGLGRAGIVVLACLSTYTQTTLQMAVTPGKPVS